MRFSPVPDAPVMPHLWLGSGFKEMESESPMERDRVEN